MTIIDNKKRREMRGYFTPPPEAKGRSPVPAQEERHTLPHQAKDHILPIRAGSERGLTDKTAKRGI